MHADMPLLLLSCSPCAWQVKKVVVEIEAVPEVLVVLVIRRGCKHRVLVQDAHPTVLNVVVRRCCLLLFVLELHMVVLPPVGCVLAAQGCVLAAQSCVWPRGLLSSQNLAAQG